MMLAIDKPNLRLLWRSNTLPLNGLFTFSTRGVPWLSGGTDQQEMTLLSCYALCECMYRKDTDKNHSI